MKVLRIQPKKYPEVIEIDGSLKSLQKEVAGLIQAVYPWDDPVADRYAQMAEPNDPNNVPF